MKPRIKNPFLQFTGCCATQPENGEWRDIFDDPVRPRRNGYEWPPDPLQVVSWLVIFVMTVLHFTTQTPYLPRTLMIVDFVISGVSIVTLILIKIALELLSQADPVVFDTSAPRMSYNEMFDTPIPEGMQTCYFCRRFVDKSSKHCSVCDKCVPGFDHHCRWLNSCIGARNYILFTVFMVVALMSMVWVFAISMYLIIWSLRDVNAFKNRMATHTYHTPRSLFPLIMVFNFIVLLGMLSGIIMMAKLIIFHITLRCRNMTTYEHILQKREKRRQLQGGATLPSDDEAPVPAATASALPQMPTATSCSVKTSVLSSICTERRRRDFKKYKGMKLPSHNDPQVAEESGKPDTIAMHTLAPLEAVQQNQQMCDLHANGSVGDVGVCASIVLQDNEPMTLCKTEIASSVAANNSCHGLHNNFSQSALSTTAVPSSSLVSNSNQQQLPGNNDSYLAALREPVATAICSDSPARTLLVEASSAPNRGMTANNVVSNVGHRRGAYTDPRRQMQDMPSFDYNEPVLNMEDILPDIRL